MSAFSRGLLLRHQCLQPSSSVLHHFIARNSFQQPRFFTSASIFRAATKVKVKPTLPKVRPNNGHSSVPNIKPTEIFKSYRSYADTLSQKSHPTLLYQAPSHTSLMVACYGTSLFCLTYAGVSYWSNTLNAPPGLAKWVPYAFSLISFMMACAGGWVLLTPSGIVKSITAIPRTMQVQVGKKAWGPELQIEVELKKMFPVPFFPARKIYVQPSELKFPSSIARPEISRLSAAEMARTRRQEEEARKKAWEYDRTHIMTSPFRHMNRGFFQAFTAMKRSWVREGFMKIQVAEKTYKLDISDGWALDGGRALDRLATKKPGV